MCLIVCQFQTIRFIQIMSLTFRLFTQVSDSGPHGRLLIFDLHLDAKVVVSLAISALISIHMFSVHILRHLSKSVQATDGILFTSVVVPNHSPVLPSIFIIVELL